MLAASAVNCGDKKGVVSVTCSKQKPDSCLPFWLSAQSSGFRGFGV